VSIHTIYDAFLYYLPGRKAILMKLVKLLFLCVLFFSTHKSCYAGDIANSVNYDQFRSLPWKPIIYRHYPNEKKLLPLKKTVLSNTGRKKTNAVKSLADGKDYSANFEKELSNVTTLPWKPTSYTHSQSKIEVSSSNCSSPLYRIDPKSLDEKIQTILGHTELVPTQKISYLMFLSCGTSRLAQDAKEVLYNNVEGYDFGIIEETGLPQYVPLFKEFKNGNRILILKEAPTYFPEVKCLCNNNPLDDIETLVDTIFEKMYHNKENAHDTVRVMSDGDAVSVISDGNNADIRTTYTYDIPQHTHWNYDCHRNIEAIKLDDRIKTILTHPALSDETKIALLTLLAWKSPLKTQAFDVLTNPITKADGTPCFKFYIQQSNNRPTHFPFLTLLANGKQVPIFNENDIVWPNELCTSLSEIKELIDPIFIEIAEASGGTYLTRHLLQ